MREFIRDNQRGLLFKNGQFVKMLSPGKYRANRASGTEVRIVVAEGQVEASLAEIVTYLKDSVFEAETVGVEVSDGQMAFRFVDGRLVGSMGAGSYRFWNVFVKNTFELVDVSSPDTEGVSREYFSVVQYDKYVKATINQGELGLLVVDGKVERTLSSGTYFFWNTQRNVEVKTYDLRVTQVDVQGQEILTLDKVALRLNFTFSYRITDPVQMEEQLSKASQQIYSTVQLTLRQYVGRFRLDELLDQKNDVAAVVLVQLQEVQDRFFVEFVDAGLKDVILPGEIRDIMNTVLVAEKKAQANVVARREEVASTRSLLNTAKLLDENATLARLKELETLERIFDKVGSISVSGNEGLLDQLGKIAGGR